MDMAYFRLYTAETQGPSITICGLNPNIYTNKLDFEHFMKMEPFVVAYYKDKIETEFPDFINGPPFMISDRYREIFELLEPEIGFKGIQLYPDSKQKKRPMPTYWIPYLPEGQYLHKDSEFYDIGIAKKLILQKETIRGKNILRPKVPVEDIWLFSLTAMESIFRRKPFGIYLNIVAVK